MWRFAPSIESPDLINPAATAPLRARIEPTERSMPPVRMTSVMPTEMQRFTDTWRITLKRLSAVAKLSEAKANATDITTKAMSGRRIELSIRRNCFVSIVLWG